MLRIAGGNTLDLKRLIDEKFAKEMNETPSIKSKNHFPIPLVCGVILLLISSVGVWLIPCPSPIQIFLIRIFIATGIACISTILPGLIHLEISGIRAVGAVAILVLIYLWNPAKLINSTSDCDLQFTSVIVNVKGKDGQVALHSKGKVVVEILSSKKSQSQIITKSIDENGQAIFPSVLIDSHMKLNIDFSEPYRPINPDSVYIIQSHSSIDFRVALHGIDRITGTVMYKDEPLSGVMVTVDTLSTFTNSSGDFLLVIPEKLQRPDYSVRFIKKGYKILFQPAYPQTDVPLPIIMEKL